MCLDRTVSDEMCQFGHKNVDHFILFSHSKHFNDETRSSKAQALIDDLRSSYSDVSAKANADDYMFLYLAPYVPFLTHNRS